MFFPPTHYLVSKVVQFGETLATVGLTYLQNSSAADQSEQT